MSEQDPTTGYEDVRRTGLNPAADYGGAEQMEVANRAIAEAKADMLRTTSDGPEQLDLFAETPADETMETPATEPEASTEQRAVLGSRAIRGALPSASPEGFSFPRQEELNPQGLSKGALEAQRQADRAFLMQQARRTAYQSGRRPGR